MQPVDELGDLGEDASGAGGGAAGARAPGHDTAEVLLGSAGEGAAGVSVAGGAALGVGADHGVLLDGGVVAVGIEAVLAVGVGQDGHVEPLELIRSRSGELGVAPAGDDGGSAGLLALALSGQGDGGSHTKNAGKKIHLLRLLED